MQVNDLHLLCNLRSFKTLNSRRSVKFVIIHYLIVLKVAQNSSQYLDFDGRYNDFLSLDTTIMVSKNCLMIGEHVVTIFVTQ